MLHGHVILAEWTQTKSFACCKHLKREDSNTCLSAQPPWDFTDSCGLLRIWISSSAPLPKISNGFAQLYETLTITIRISKRFLQPTYWGSIRPSVTTRQQATFTSMCLRVSANQHDSKP